MAPHDATRGTSCSSSTRGPSWQRGSHRNARRRSRRGRLAPRRAPRARLPARLRARLPRPLRTPLPAARLRARLSRPLRARLPARLRTRLPGHGRGASGSARARLREPTQALHLGLREAAALACLEATEAERAERHSLELDHPVSHGLHHAPHLALAALADGHLEYAGRGFSRHGCRCGRSRRFGTESSWTTGGPRRRRLGSPRPGCSS